MALAALKASGLGLVRNEAATRFPHAEDAVALEELQQRVEEALLAEGWDEPWIVADLDEWGPLEMTHLVEEGLMTPGFADGAGEGRGFAIYGDGEASIEIGGADHLRLLGFRTGDELAVLWSLLSRLDDRLEQYFAYAFDPSWGYLASSPDNAGTGLKVYATLSVPSLMLTGKLARVAVDLVSAGYGLSPLWGGVGGVVQVSNVGRQGKSELEMIDEIEGISRDIIERERSVRKMFMRENPIHVRDHIGRALGIAQQAWNMTFPESVNLLAAVEVGFDLGLIEVPGLAFETPFDLMCRLQPAHVVLEQMEGWRGGLDDPEVDQVRARVLREVFSGARVLS